MAYLVANFVGFWNADFIFLVTIFYWNDHDHHPYVKLIFFAEWFEINLYCWNFCHTLDSYLVESCFPFWLFLGVIILGFLGWLYSLGLFLVDLIFSYRLRLGSPYFMYHGDQFLILNALVRVDTFTTMIYCSVFWLFPYWLFLLQCGVFIDPFYVDGLIKLSPVLLECDGSQLSTLWTVGGVRHFVPAMPCYR